MHGYGERAMPYVGLLAAAFLAEMDRFLVPADSLAHRCAKRDEAAAALQEARRATAARLGLDWPPPAKRGRGQPITKSIRFRIRLIYDCEFLVFGIYFVIIFAATVFFYCVLL